MAWWLMKTEPGVFSIDDLAARPSEVWDGVRNYQARNLLRTMVPGDLAFVYHSNASPSGVVGLARVVRADVVDPSQFDPTSPYHDPKATPEAPRWWTVEVAHEQTFPRLVSLAELKDAFPPDELPVVRRGQRLSVLPVTPAAAARLLEMAAKP